MSSDAPYPSPGVKRVKLARCNTNNINRLTPSCQPSEAMQRRPNTNFQPVVGAISVELQEIQQPLQARKYGSVDRRPIDPPPVVRLRVLEMMALPPDMAIVVREEITSFIDTSKFVCVAHLYPYGGPSIVSAVMPCESSHCQSSSTCPANDYVIPAEASRGAHEAIANSRFLRPTLQDGNDLSSYLAGGKVVTPSTITLDDEQVVVFAFTDLSVRLDGEFYLQYRLFDLAMMIPMPGSEKPTSKCQAACIGGPFTVYPAKEAPCLPPSTRTTKALYDAGIRVAYRARCARRRGVKRSRSDAFSPE
ncbi:velvet factor-domain-containing protein [Schizophyllum commune]